MGCGGLGDGVWDVGVWGVRCGVWGVVWGTNDLVEKWMMLVFCFFVCVCFQDGVFVVNNIKIKVIFLVESKEEKQ